MKKYLDIRDGSLEDAVKKTAEKNIRVEKAEDPKLGSSPKNYLDVRPDSIEAAVSKVVSEETEYQKMFKKELEKTGKTIPQMSDAEKKAFFDKMDSKYKAKNEGATDKEINKFHKKLDNLVHKSFGHSSDEKKKEVKEKVDNPYAVGMAAAMKKTGDKPPLKKSTVTKAHDIAKSIEKDEKKESSHKKSYKEMKKETKGKAMTGSPMTKVDVDPKMETK